MEDDKLKSIFSNFDPELSSDVAFLNRLQENLTSVEFIRKRAANERSKNKIAVAIAASIGFIVGFLFSLVLPYLSVAVSEWQLTLPDDSFLKIVADNFIVIAWIVIGGTSVLAALNSYEISLSLQKPKEV